MLGEFLMRLAVALPLVCGLAALSLWAVRRGWLRLPGLSIRQGHSASPRNATGELPLEILAVRSLSPAARLAVVRFDGRELLVGLSGQSVALLARAEPTPPELRPLKEMAP